MQMYSNLKVGLTPIIMLDVVDYLHEVVQKIPLERIVLETDAPYFVNLTFDYVQHGTYTKQFHWNVWFWKLILHILPTKMCI